jgi:hypothetical protein
VIHRRFGHAEVFALIAASSFAVARWVPVLTLPLVCPFRAITGVPCLSCGMTHAFVHLAHGRVAASIQANPLGAALAAASWAFLLLDAARWLRGLPLPELTLSERARRFTLASLGAAAALDWAYLILHAA